VAIITLNESRNIVRCLKSLRFSKNSFSRVEVLVVDAQSTDNTVALAKAHGAKTYIRPWKGYADQKNWTLQRCKGDWILSLDADEELTPEGCREIETKLANTPKGMDAYEFKRRAFFLGKWIRHCGWWPDTQRRLIRKGSGAFTNDPVHEGLEVKGETLLLDEAMNHYTYDSIRQYLDKMNRYSDLDALRMKPKKLKYWWFYMLWAPFFTFIRMYISRRGFLDGWHGLMVCGLSTFHDFVRYAKMWEKKVLTRR
jgi:glycosyltransferase involved in cell wall biosynthesis